MPSTISAGTTAGTAIAIAGDTTGNLAFQTNGTTTAMTIDTSQNVGIGTTSPTSTSGGTTLAVKSSTHANMVGEVTAVDYSAIWEGRRTGRSTTSRFAQINLAVDSSDNGSVRFYTAPVSNDITERMRIDSAGRVTMPYQPVFSAYGSQGSLANGSTCIAGGVDVNIGSNYNASNGRFTAPIAGTYYFIGTNQWNGTTNGYYYGFQFKKNTLFVGQGIFQVTHSANDNSCTQAIILTLAANDYVIMTTYTQSTPTTTFTNFAGYLIG